MKREAFILLIGASLAGSTDLEGQRRGKRDRHVDERVERLEPVHAPGRVVARPVYRSAPHGGRRASRVVYTSRRGYGGEVGWIRTDWRRAIRLRPIPLSRHRDFLNRGELNGMLGRRTVERIRDAGRSAGFRGAMRGHWVVQRGFGDLLVVTMGGSDVAELVDFNRDGIVDEMYVVGPVGHRRVGWR
jgi:hypothetical protein